MTSASSMATTPRARAFAAFWLMGLLNNSGYVIMNSLAKDILPGVVGLVYFVNIFPTLIIKITGPYWYHLVSFKLRVTICTVCMLISYVVVALSTSVPAQLLGIAIGSITGGLGEPTILSYTSRFSSKDAITAWSSGTGFAGVFGYGWTIMFTQVFGLSKFVALLVANVLPLAYFIVFRMLEQLADERSNEEGVGVEHAGSLDPIDVHSSNTSVDSAREDAMGDENTEQVPLVRENQELGIRARETVPSGFRDRTKFVLRLWPFTIPLFVVYASEYMLQAGTWSAIGFPIDSAEARHEFYVYANWCYQIGVFLSRSSGMCFPTNRVVLWTMPLLQFGFLLFFAANSAFHFWWDYSVLVAVFVVGLLGGAVYVCAFVSISKHFEKSSRTIQELALSSASFADTLGILLANLLSVWIQHCLYSINGVSDAAGSGLVSGNTTVVHSFSACFD